MNIIFEVAHGSKSEVTMNQLQFNWNDMLQFGQWCAENEAIHLDGITLADYLKEQFNIEII